MDFNGTTLEHLSRDQCLQLMGQVPLGRIVYTRQALPAAGGGTRMEWQVPLEAAPREAVPREEAGDRDPSRA